MNPVRDKNIVNFGNYGKVDFSVFRCDCDKKYYNDRVYDELKPGTKRFNEKVLNTVERLSVWKEKGSVLLEIEQCVDAILSTFLIGSNKETIKDGILKYREEKNLSSESSYRLAMAKEKIKEILKVKEVDIVEDSYIDSYFNIYIDSLKDFEDTSYFDGLKISKNPEKIFENGKSVKVTIFVNLKNISTAIITHISERDYCYNATVDHSKIVNEFVATFVAATIRDQNRIRVTEQISAFLKILSESNESGLSFINTISSYKIGKWSEEGEKSRLKAWKIVTDVYGDMIKEFEMNDLVTSKKNENENSLNYAFARYEPIEIHEPEGEDECPKNYDEVCCEEPVDIDKDFNGRSGTLHLTRFFSDKWNTLDPIDMIEVVENSSLVLITALLNVPTLKKYVEEGKVQNSNTNSLKALDIRSYDENVNYVKSAILAKRIIPFLFFNVFVQNDGKKYTAFKKVYDILSVCANSIEKEEKDFDTVYVKKFANPMTTTNSINRVVFDAIASYDGEENVTLDPNGEKV